MRNVCEVIESLRVFVFRVTGVALAGVRKKRQSRCALQVAAWAGM
jgi:hypothetical protein